MDHRICNLIGRFAFCQTAEQGGKLSVEVSLEQCLRYFSPRRRIKLPNRGENLIQRQGDIGDDNN
ncbi:MAG: hypothetical protein HY784_04885 [Chloroflexi bacterium]|nr:hypothetical protein [Chloroflexota bacterium]